MEQICSKQNIHCPLLFTPHCYSMHHVAALAQDLIVPSAFQRDRTYSCLQATPELSGHTRTTAAYQTWLHSCLPTADPGTFQIPHPSEHTCHNWKNRRLSHSAPGSNTPIKTRLWMLLSVCTNFSMLDKQPCWTCWSAVITVMPVNSPISSVPSGPYLFAYHNF